MIVPYDVKELEGESELTGESSTHSFIHKIFEFFFGPFDYFFVPVSKKEKEEVEQEIREEGMEVEQEIEQVIEEPLPELEMDKYYKNGRMMLCRTMKKVPISSFIVLKRKDIGSYAIRKKYKDELIHVELVLDYTDKKDINLDDHKKSKRSIVYCMMFLKLYINAKFVMKTDNFPMDGYLDSNLYDFELGFIEEMFGLRRSFFSDKNKWGDLSEEWIRNEQYKLYYTIVGSKPLFKNLIDVFLGVMILLVIIVTISTITYVIVRGFKCE